MLRETLGIASINPRDVLDNETPFDAILSGINAHVYIITDTYEIRKPLPSSIFLQCDAY